MLVDGSISLFASTAENPVSAEIAVSSVDLRRVAFGACSGRCASWTLYGEKNAKVVWLELLINRVSESSSVNYVFTRIVLFFELAPWILSASQGLYLHPMPFQRSIEPAHRTGMD